MTTPIITAALSRKSRRNPRAVHVPGGEGGVKKSRHNYLAQAPKRKAGAPLGNRNASRHGAAKRDRRAALEALIRELCATADAAMAACDRGGAERAALMALLESRP